MPIRRKKISEKENEKDVSEISKWGNEEGKG